MANIFFERDRANLREAGVGSRAEVPYSFGGPQLLIGEHSRIDAALCSTALLLAGLLLGLASIFWIGTR